jgi:hypothetical protein
VSRPRKRRNPIHNVAEGDGCGRPSSGSLAVCRNGFPLFSELNKPNLVGSAFCLRGKRGAAVCEGIIDRGQLEFFLVFLR